MARFEQDREDILREATALVQRIELELAGFSEPVTVGFRRDGSASFYFGADLVLQFNTHGELRRGYDNGRLIKADAGNLVSMEKHRTENAVELRSHPLIDEERRQFLQRAERHLTSLRTAFAAGNVRVLRQLPQELDLAAEVAAWLGAHAEQIAVARAPHAR